MRRILVGVVVSYFEVEYMEVAVHNLSLRHHYLKVDNLKQIPQFSNAKHVLNLIISLLLHTNCLRDNSHPICIFAVFMLVKQNWFLCVHTVSFLMRASDYFHWVNSFFVRLTIKQ